MFCIGIHFCVYNPIYESKFNEYYNIITTRILIINIFIINVLFNYAHKSSFQSLKFIIHKAIYIYIHPNFKTIPLIHEKILQE